MVDRELLLAKLEALDRYLRELARYRGISPEELRDSLEKTWVVEHGLQLCIQIVLDVGNHILADHGLAVSEYGDIFPELVRLGVLPEKFAGRIDGMAGFRNILVHEYGKVDLARVAQVLKHNLEDFRKFSRYVLDYLG